MNKNIGRIGILLGGPSSERGISIKSGTAVFNALVSLGLDVVCIDPEDTSSVKENILRANINVAFIALHGRFGEDGTLQIMLEELGIPYTGSGPQASRLALNKILSKELFRANNIPVPLYKVLRKNDEPFSVLKEFSLPFVVKPSREGSSIGLSIVDRREDFLTAIDTAFSYDEEILIEEYIDGEDITVGILEERPLPVIHIKPKARYYSFHAKYTPGMTEYIVPAELPEDIRGETQRLGLSAHSVLGCRGFSRVDMLLERQTGRIAVLEVNTIPGLTSISLLPKAARAIGIDFPQLCLRMLELALEEKAIYGEEEKKDKGKIKAIP